MATRSVSLLEQGGLGAALSRPLQPGPEILGMIYAAHHGHVLNVCRRFFRRPEDAEDAAAEVFLKLHTVLERKDDAHPFRPWVCQVAGRHCIDKLRRRKREKCSTVAGDDLYTIPDNATPSPLSQFLRKEARRQLRDQLNRLPNHYRIPLMMRYYKRMSYLEIARTLNRQLSAVKTTIFRAKNRLRRDLRRAESERRAPEAQDRQLGATQN